MSGETTSCNLVRRTPTRIHRTRQLVHLNERTWCLNAKVARGLVTVSQLAKKPQNLIAISDAGFYVYFPLIRNYLILKLVWYFILYLL